ncbi:hypothetical protein OEA41_003290 [Lepraria neglecta]|uniref:Orotate phosphoribosyltransferase n=1 Tax=Lepraria neglecta TaxID=209136 RepID=A0AAE0DIV2_9LECA|nr:hypothetical protein OEA41_003290 [Lepraria neglecta]
MASHAQEGDPDDLVPSGTPTTATLPPYKSAFLQACLSASVLTFGIFTLKSGRQSPYFFNAGLFHEADLLHDISIAFAQTLISHISLNPTFSFDVLFGPAYKGVPLATAVALGLRELDPQRFGKVKYSFNRKEIKDHGDGGAIVGAPLKGKKVVVVDDVITAGTAMREAVEIIRGQGGILVGVVIALNRMERMRDDGGGSAIGEVKKQYGVPVLSIVDLNDLIGTLGGTVKEEDVRRMEEYKRRYGASD